MQVQPLFENSDDWKFALDYKGFQKYTLAKHICFLAWEVRMVSEDEIKRLQNVVRLSVRCIANK